MAQKPKKQENGDMSGRERMVGGQRAKSTPEVAFEHWLQRGLHAMFDDVASEPIPDELLRLIQEDRDK